nr:putative reverse transcriptase domain, ribonuclease H-like domain, aspartic peptidase domain protein [Tanacetum cinerariifolium]
MTTAQNEGAEHEGPPSICNRYGARHYGDCMIKFHKCGKIWRKEIGCRGKAISAGAQPIVTCYGCGEKGHTRTIAQRGTICKKVEFRIKLVPSSAPVARAPYRLAPFEMKELADQLQELSEKGFILPSTSPWGAPLLALNNIINLGLCIMYVVIG